MTRISTPEEPLAISVVVPVYNEEECVQELATRLHAVLGQLSERYEVIFVNDGSQDRSLQLLREIHQRDSRFKILNLSRNFGHQIAATAGLDYAVGSVVILMDGDLQDPPELIPELYARYLEGYDVVYAVRASREKETHFKLLTARAFYRVFRWATDIEMPADAGDFRLMSRRVVDTICRMRERHRILRGMVAWSGFRQSGVIYARAGRYAGKTKYPLRSMLRLAADGLTSFSTLPLRLASWLGLCVSMVSFVYALCAISSHLWGETVEGWTSLMVVLAFLGGVQLICLGIIGEYLGRVYEEAKARPLYIVSDFVAEALNEETLPT